MSTTSAEGSTGRLRFLVVVAAVVVAVALGAVYALGGFATSSTLASPEVVAHTGLVNNDTPVQTTPISVAQGSLLVLFLSWPNAIVGGGYPVSITDSLFDIYHLEVSTSYATNHTEAVYAASPALANSSLVVTVTFAAGATPMGGSVSVVDVSHANLSSIDGTYWDDGFGPTAGISVVANHTGDLVLFGAAGRGVSGPFTAGPGATLLDTGTGTSGPFQDGTGFGTLSAVASGTTIQITASLNVPTGWVATAVAIR